MGIESLVQGDAPGGHANKHAAVFDKNARKRLIIGGVEGNTGADLRIVVIGVGESVRGIKIQAQSDDHKRSQTVD